MTKLNFSSLFAKAWYHKILPDLANRIRISESWCMFFDSSAIKPYTSTLEASKSPTMKDQLSQKETADIPECKSSKQFTQQQILLYECRYEMVTISMILTISNGFDKYILIHQRFPLHHLEFLKQVQVTITP